MSGFFFAQNHGRVIGEWFLGYSMTDQTKQITATCVVVGMIYFLQWQLLLRFDYAFVRDFVFLTYTAGAAIGIFGLVWSYFVYGPKLRFFVIVLMMVGLLGNQAEYVTNDSSLSYLCTMSVLGCMLAISMVNKQALFRDRERRLINTLLTRFQNVLFRCAPNVRNAAEANIILIAQRFTQSILEKKTEKEGMARWQQSKGLIDAARAQDMIKNHFMIDKIVQFCKYMEEKKFQDAETILQRLEIMV